MKIPHLLLLTGLLIAALAAQQSATAQAPASNATTIEHLGPEACQAIAACYAYDSSIPLAARVVERAKQDEGLREKIVFRGVNGFLVPGYLQLPPDRTGPSPCVLLLHGWSGSKENWWQNDNYISGGNVRRALLAAGYAVLALDAQCHGDRIAQNDFAPVNHYIDPDQTGPARKGYFTQPEIYIQTVRDYRRAIDYLETRSDIDKARIGILGYSMGGTQTFALTGVEPRIKTAVAVAAPADHSKWSLIAPQNFLTGIGNRPFLTIIGRTDELCPLPRAQALQQLIESPTKDQILFDAGHNLPPDYVPHAVEWLKKYL